MYNCILILQLLTNMGHISLVRVNCLALKMVDQLRCSVKWATCRSPPWNYMYMYIYVFLYSYVPSSPVQELLSVGSILGTVGQESSMQYVALSPSPHVLRGSAG